MKWVRSDSIEKENPDTIRQMIVDLTVSGSADSIISGSAALSTYYINEDSNLKISKVVFLVPFNMYISNLFIRKINPYKQCWALAPLLAPPLHRAIGAK